MDRSLVLRTCIKEHNEYAFEEPFERIGAEMRDSDYNRVEYTVSDILIPFGNQHDCDALAGDFPYNIVQHCSTLFNIVQWIWSKPGSFEEDSWILLCRLEQDVYAFYRARHELSPSGYTMELYVSRHLAEIITQGMNKDEYELYEAETTSI